MTRPWRRWAFIAAGVALSALFLFLSFRKVEFRGVWSEMARIALPALILAPVVRLLGFAAAALRSRVLFAPLRPVGSGRMLKSILLAFAVNNVVPLRAGELARIGYLARTTELPASTCLAIVALERLLDLLAIVAIVVCTLPAMASGLPVGSSFYILTAVLVLAIGGALWVSRKPRFFVSIVRFVAGLFGATIRGFVERRAETFAEGLSGLGSARSVVAVVGLSLLSWLLTTLNLHVWIWAFGLDLPWYAPVVLLAFLSFGLAIPSTPGHIGSFHFFTIAALASVGVAETESVAFAVVVHAMAVVPFTLLALPLLFRDTLGRQSRSIEKTAHE